MMFGFSLATRAGGCVTNARALQRCKILGYKERVQSRCRLEPRSCCLLHRRQRWMLAKDDLGRVVLVGLEEKKSLLMLKRDLRGCGSKA